jgi:hypothetical protein
VPAAVERQARELLAIGDSMRPEDRERQVLVPPQIGLEDSSRHHSWAMILEHLAIVGDRTGALLLALTHGRVPEGTVGTAQLKPRPGVEADEARARYQEMLRRFRKTVLERCGDWSSPARCAHPWFGPMGARRWAAFVPFHQAIHLKQARRIRARLQL